VAVRYDADWPASIYEALESLTFAPYALESAAPAELMRLQLLKRLESSATAFRRSLRALRSVTELFLTGAPRTPASQRSDDWVQLLLPIAIDGLEQSKRRLHLRQDALNDAELLRTCERALRGLPDNKLQQLVAVLERECPAAKVLVFSQFTDTAVYLWKQLHTRFRAGLVTGSDARLGANRAARGTVLESFAPRASGRGTRLHERLQLDVLIATDVLSEGLNLQDANVVVNYEIAWNPVTLMQRIGRVDRLGSAHASVRVYNFIPERGLDRLLRLLERVETKLATIERLVGSDAPVLDAPRVGSARQAIEQSLRLPVEGEPVTLAPLSEIEALRAELNGEPRAFTKARLQRHCLATGSSCCWRSSGDELFDFSSMMATACVKTRRKRLHSFGEHCRSPPPPVLVKSTRAERLPGSRPRSAPQRCVQR
jgi:hypothetical protein